MMDKWKRNRCIRHFWSVSCFTDKQVITYHHRFLHRRGGNRISLNKEQPDKSGCYNSENNGINPFNDLCLFTIYRVFLFPEGPMNFLRYVDIVNYDESVQPPVIVWLNYPRLVKSTYKAKVKPFI